VTITASYSYGGVSTEATHDVQIVDVPVSNQPPEADAGPDQSVDEGDIVKLNGSNSTDPDDGIDSFLWMQTSGTPVALSSISSPQPTFTAPDVEPDGMALTFQLTVTDKGDLDSTDECIVNVSWVNQPPKADAGSDQTVEEGSVVLLDGSSSSDLEDGIVSYHWTQKSGLPVALDNPAAMQPRFTAPDVGPQGGSVSFLLTVSDAGGLQATDDCIVNVSWVNEPPRANAGPDSSCNEHEVVMLDGSGSEDPDDGIASYRWHQQTGTPVTLDDPTAVQPSFRAPDVKPGGESLAFQLKVSDTGGLQSTDDCVVDVAEANTKSVDINELGTGTYVTSGRGKNKSTAFVVTDAFGAGESVVIRVYVVDATDGRPLANVAVEITVTGPETAIFLTGLSDANGMVEAKWTTSRPKNRVKPGTPSGTYTATVNNVTADGYAWEGVSTASTTFTIR
jgi:hypothetical protein